MGAYKLVRLRWCGSLRVEGRVMLVCYRARCDVLEVTTILRGINKIIKGRLNDLTVFVVRQRFVKVTNSSNHVLSPFEWMQQSENTSRVFVRVRNV